MKRLLSFFQRLMILITAACVIAACQNGETTDDTPSPPETDTTAPSAGNAGAITVSNLTDSSLTLNWSKATDEGTLQSNLRYMVYKATSDVVGTVTQMETYGTAQLSDPKVDMNSWNVTGLDDATTYYFNVVVMDSAGNKRAYTTKSVTTVDATAPIPGNSGGIRVDASTDSSLTISWTAAVDNGSNPSDLDYRIYTATANTIDTPANLLANGAPFDVTVDSSTTSKTVTGLDDGTLYYVNILVVDEEGNSAVYNTASEKTADGTGPVPGNSGSITVSNLSISGLTLNWTDATDNVSESTNLRYSIYQSNAADLTSDSDMIDSGKEISLDMIDTNTLDVSGLSDSTTYYFNIVVTDEAGNTSAYTMVSFTTLDATDPVAGTLSVDGSSDSSISLSWTQATDNMTSQADLGYRLYRSSSGDIDTVANILSNGTSVDSTYDSQTTSKTASELDDGQTYWFNLIVWDEENNTAAYSMVSEKTADITDPSVDTPTLTVSNLTESSLTLGWSKASDNGTLQSALSYSVYEATSDTLSTISDMETYGTLIDSGVDIDSSAVSGLDEATAYWFNVMVADETGNRSAYTVKSVTTNDITDPIPGNSGTISIDATTDSSITIGWTAANDNGTAQADLLYDVYYATDASVDTLANIDSFGTPFGSTYDASTDTVEITGLSDWTTHYVNVVVTDNDGNRAAYSMQNARTGDVTTPTAGSFSTTTNLEPGSLTLNWTSASDTGTATSNLQYRVYESTSDNISTVAEMESNGLALNSYTTNITTLDATGLNDETTYYFNLIVKDEAGNKTAYTRIFETTPVGDPVNGAQGVSFTDEDGNAGQIGGTVTITKASDETDVDSYVLYWGNGPTAKLSATPIATYTATGSDVTHDFGLDTPIYYDPTADVTSDYLLVFTQNQFGEMSAGVNVAINDRTVPYNLASDVTFDGDTDNGNGGNMDGTITITKATEENDITHYVIYWGPDTYSDPCTDADIDTNDPNAIIEIPKLGSDGGGIIYSGANISYTFSLLITPNYPTLNGYFLIFSKNEGGEMSSCIATPWTDDDGGGP